MTEPTPLNPLVHNSPTHTSGPAGDAIGERVQPERDEIRLKPCKGFPRHLVIEWSARRVSVSILTSNSQTLVSARVDVAQISLFAHTMKFEWLKSKTAYALYADDTSFSLSEREFNTLVAKLESRGVKVDRT